MIQIEPQTLDPRRALKVQRYHTWPVIRQQSVGEHTAQLWRIFKAIWPDVPMRVLDFVLIHDMPELVLGDMPYPSKALHPGIKPILKELEQEIMQQMKHSGWGISSIPTLTVDELVIFKCVEFIEMWEYGLDELASGNLAANLIVNRWYEAAKGCLAQMSLMEEKDDVYTRANAYMLTRLVYHRRLVGEQK
jgi:HD domain